MAAVIRGLVDSPLADSYRLDTLSTYVGTAPLRRLLVFCRALVELTIWSLRGRGRIVHVHATVRGSAYRKSVCVLLAKTLRRRVVLHVHSGPGDVANFRERLGRPSVALFRSAFKAADVVIAVSSASARALEHAYGLTDVAVLPNAAPPGPAERRPDEEQGAPVEAIYLGGFANAAKAGDTLLEALPTVLERAPELRVMLAGPGELPEAGAALLERFPQLSWIGWMDHAAKDDALRRARIFVLSSRSEGLPIALLEAMAYEMAIVSTTVGGVPEVVEDGREALLVPIDDPSALADALVRVAEDATLRAALATAARERVEDFSPSAIAARLDAIYTELL